MKHKNVYSGDAIKSYEINLLSNVAVNGEPFWDEVRIPKIHVSRNAKIIFFLFFFMNRLTYVT